MHCQLIQHSLLAQLPISPTSRTRLVVASQALEIQHLQDLLKSRDKETADIGRRALEERQETEKALIARTEQISRLEAQVVLLGDKLREMEEGKEARIGEEVAVVMSMTQAGKDRD